MVGGETGRKPPWPAGWGEGVSDSLCAACPTPDRRYGLPCGECPICGTFWTPTQAHNGTGYGIVGISREDYRAWMQANGHGTTPPALHLLPNVVMQTATRQEERPPTRLQAFLRSKGVDV